MAEFGYTRTQLPSRGQLYGGSIPDGLVELRKLSAQEEGMLAAAVGNADEKLSALIAACVKFPEKDFKPRDLLLTDRFALLLAIRTATHGFEYEVNFKCRFCGKANLHARINIRDTLNVKYGGIAASSEEPVEQRKLFEPFEVTTPDSGVLMLRFLRGTDESRIAQYVVQLDNATGDGEKLEYTYRIANMLVAAGEIKFSNITSAHDFAKRLSGGDTAAIRRRLNEVESGIDTTIYPVCRAANCQMPNEMGMPFTDEFFRPT